MLGQSKPTIPAGSAPACGKKPFERLNLALLADPQPPVIRNQVVHMGQKAVAGLPRGSLNSHGPDAPQVGHVTGVDT